MGSCLTALTLAGCVVFFSSAWLIVYAGAVRYTQGFSPHLNRHSRAYGEKGGWGGFGEATAIFANLVIGLGYGSGHQRESACGTMPFRVVGWFQYYGMKTQATLHVASQCSFL